MEAVTEARLGVEEKAQAFGEYLEEIGLPVERVLGDLGPAEVEDVVSFFYAGVPDRFKGVPRDQGVADDQDEAPMPVELWCAAVWESEDIVRLIA